MEEQKFYELDHFAKFYYYLWLIYEMTYLHSESDGTYFANKISHIRSSFMQDVI